MYINGNEKYYINIIQDLIALMQNEGTISNGSEVYAELSDYTGISPEEWEDILDA